MPGCKDALQVEFLGGWAKANMREIRHKRESAILGNELDGRSMDVRPGYVTHTTLSARIWLKQ